MSVALPPPPTPQLGTAAQLQQQVGSGVTVGFQQYQIHVLANNVLGEADIHHAIEVASNISNAVRNLGAAAYLAGFPAAQVTYALSGQDLYVLVTPGKVSSVVGSEPLMAYMGGLQNDDPLKSSQLEKARTLASMAADRAGVDIYPVFKPDGAGGEVLDLSKSRDSDPTTVRTEFGNPGNRFSSRYFLDLDLKTGSVWGDEAEVFWRHGLSQLDNQGHPGDYNEQDALWNRVTPYGVFGLSGRYVNYFYNPNGEIPVDGRIYTGQASWLYPLFADFNNRLNFEGKVDLIGRRTALQDNVTVSSGAGSSPLSGLLSGLGPIGGLLGSGTPTTETFYAGETLNNQVYTSAEIGLGYVSNFQLLAHKWSFEGAAAVRRGFGKDQTDNPGVASNLGYTLVRPVARLKFFWNDNFDTGIEGSGQLSTDTLPEEQQWVLGGIGNITSMVPGVAVGDKGYLARVFTEVTIPDSVLGMTFTPKVFVEQGGTQYVNPGQVAGQVSGIQKVTDWGGSLDFKFAKFVYGGFAYAHDFSDRNISASSLEQARARLFFHVGAKF